MGELAYDAGKLDPEDARRKLGIQHTYEAEKWKQSLKVEDCTVGSSLFR